MVLVLSSWFHGFLLAVLGHFFAVATVGRARPPIPVFSQASRMTSTLETFFNKKVLIITNDGRTLVGMFQGYDQTINVILSEASERVYSSFEGVQTVPLGVYMIRGDNIAVVGEIDVEVDAELDYSSIKAEPLRQIVH